jgi:hypothetical protein
MARGDPLDGQVLMIAAAKASVPLHQLPTLVDRVQSDLGPRLETYRRRYEAVHESAERCVFMVPLDHWESVGERLDLTTRERSAVRRAHEEQLRRIGSDEGRSEEFESALDIRSAVVVGRKNDESEGPEAT